MSRATNRRTRRRQRKLPLRDRLLHNSLRFIFRVGGRWLPGPTTQLAYRLWISTRRFPTPVREMCYEETATREYLDHNGLPLASYRWGDGPRILLVHGWSGRATQLHAFVDPLVEAGYQVIAVDGPAHGRTPGKQTNLLEYVAALDEVNERFGPFEGTIAHSFGTPAVMLALDEDKLSTQRVVAISPPSTLLGMLDKFAAALELPKTIVSRLTQRVNADFGADIWQRLSVEAVAPNLKAAALIIHDENDQEVPIAEGETTAAHWPGAILKRTRGYGHRRILRASEVVDAAVSFIASGYVETDPTASVMRASQQPSRTTQQHAPTKETEALNDVEVGEPSGI